MRNDYFKRKFATAIDCNKKFKIICADDYTVTEHDKELAEFMFKAVESRIAQKRLKEMKVRENSQKPFDKKSYIMTDDELRQYEDNKIKQYEDKYIKPNQYTINKNWIYAMIGRINLKNIFRYKDWHIYNIDIAMEYRKSHFSKNAVEIIKFCAEARLYYKHIARILWIPEKSVYLKAHKLWLEKYVSISSKKEKSDMSWKIRVLDDDKMFVLEIEK